MRVRKFRVHVRLKDNSLVKPVIETNCRSQAQRIVEAQYPGCRVGVIEELSSQSPWRPAPRHKQRRRIQPKAGGDTGQAINSKNTTGSVGNAASSQFFPRNCMF